MKEITRRLYTKPIMLGMTFLVGVVLVIGLFVTTKSKAAFTFIAAGNDEFETTGNGESYHNFAASPIPADFFGPGSEKYTGVVPLVGVPLAEGSDTDTIISRDQSVDGSGTTTLTMKGLSLNSINPIIVSYSGGGSEKWDVHVSLSDTKASTGSMTINSGGTFDSSLKVWPKFTFTRQSDHVQKVLDTGGSDGGGLAPQSATQIGGGGSDGGSTAIAICRATAVNDFQTVAQNKAAKNRTFATAAASTGCAPVTLTSTNSPWQICSNGHFCIPKPITEQELLASHNASPPGTKRGVVVQ
jgi:hypothetical protein